MRHACKKISQLASDRLDRPLSLLERLKFKLHLSMCSHCRDFDHNIKLIHKVTAMMHTTDYGQTRLSEKQRQQLHNNLNAIK